MTDEKLLQYGIAIIGMSGRFPEANSVDTYWDNIKSGKESIRFFTDSELAAAGITEVTRKNPHYVPAKAVLDDIAGFDAAFFGINPREAELLDPQQRIFLECVWEAFERGGYNPFSYSGRIGTFASVSKNTYLLFNLMTHPELYEAHIANQVLIANDKDYISSRTAYKLNLRGPALTIQTACSSSLVAIHMACQSLLAGECEMAIAGGASIDVPHLAGYLYQPGSIFSPDGHVRVFDANARGTVFGHGVGVILLKPLAKALEDNDTICAVIRSSAINNDGSNKTGFTAPSVEGQAEVIAEAIALADIDPTTISYIEAHGTGTALGDPIEVEALTRAFRSYTDERQFCALGSVKSNIGHLNVASGVAGVIKAALSLQNRYIPPSLNFERPNPHIDFDTSPFYVSKGHVYRENAPRRAGVSSFGIGGTNAHLILEEAPEQKRSPVLDGLYLLPLSARSKPQLEKMKRDLLTFIDVKKPRIDDVAYTLQVGRHTFSHSDAIAIQVKDGKNEIVERQNISQVISGYRIPLPTYPFEHKRYWIEPKVLHREIAEAKTSYNSVEEAIAEIFAKLLGVEKVGLQDDFFDLGGHSLLGAELLQEMKTKFNCTLPLNALFDAATPEGIARLLKREEKGGRSREVEEDLLLDSNIRPAAFTEIAPLAILLTGATGFLGSYLLQELLEKTTAPIYCLVRDASMSRLKEQANRYGIWNESVVDRITLVEGDLSKPKLGMSDKEYELLSEKITSIYHCGARLSFIDPYRVLRKINVEGTRSVIKFACYKRTKHIHHVSSIAAYDSDTFKGLDLTHEDLALDQSSGFHSGYDETKWVSEMLINEAAKRGCPVTIYRPGNISGDSRTGICSAQDLVGIMIRGCVDLQAAPSNDDFVDLVPIDYVSSALVTLSLQPGSLNQRYNLVNPAPSRWIDLVQSLQAAGHAIETVSFEEWCERLRKAPDNVLYTLLPMFDERPLFSNRRYCSKKVVEALKDSQIRCRAIDATLVQSYCNHMAII